MTAIKLKENISHTSTERRAGQYCNFSALDISYRINRNVTIYYSFYKSLWVDCSIKVFRYFSLIWFCEYQASVFSSRAETNTNFIV